MVPRMTEDKTDAGVGRLTRRYAEVQRKIASVNGFLHEKGAGAERAAVSLRNMNFGDYEKTKSEFDAVPWAEISDHLGKLAELARERDRIQDCLRQAGLGTLVGIDEAGGKVVPAGDND